MSGPRSGLRVRHGYGKLTYAQKVEAGICVRCHAHRLPEEIYARCDTCLEQIAAHNRQRYRKHGGRAQKRRHYLANREAILADRKEQRVQRKLRKICRDCPNPSRDDSVFCESCTKKRAEYSREIWNEQRWHPMPTKDDANDV